MKVTSSDAQGSSPVDPNNYNIHSVKNNLGKALHHFTGIIDQLIQNPDQINEQNLGDLASSIKELKKYSDLAQKAPTNSALGQTLYDSGTIINNTLQAPIDV